MIDRSHDLPLVKQAKALGISRAASILCPGRFRRPISPFMAAHGRAASGLSVRWQPMLRDLLALEGIKTDACTSRR